MTIYPRPILTDLEFTFRLALTGHGGSQSLFDVYNIYLHLSCFIKPFIIDFVQKNVPTFLI